MRKRIREATVKGRGTQYKLSLVETLGFPWSICILQGDIPTEIKVSLSLLDSKR